jgi:TonB-dependent SusC/RagA subfamily outer membrane receptor
MAQGIRQSADTEDRAGSRRILKFEDLIRKLNNARPQDCKTFRSSNPQTFRQSAATVYCCVVSFFVNCTIQKNEKMKTRFLILLLVALVAGSQAEGQKKSRLITVTGMVTDTAMAPVSGALIIVDWESAGATSRSNGSFKIKIKPDVKTVGVYTSNMGSAVTAYEGQTSLNFVLDGREALINFTPPETVSDTKINIGYATVKKKDLTTDVGYIDGQDNINKGYTNIYDMISGRVPGVSVQGNRIIIRGVNTINSGTDPLFVVDGVVVSSIDNISPNLVKSISVLKGPDAAIYGSRGAGGVILITLMGAGK